MKNATNIAQVAIKHSETDYQIIITRVPEKGNCEAYLAGAGKKIEFIDFDEGRIPMLAALKAITELIKKLRSEGTLMSSMA